jgi:hypothetical protein
MKDIKIYIFVILTMAFSSCNDFLDETPDSRIDVNTEEEIKAMLTSAYPTATFVRVTELASDNADDLNGDLNGNYDRFSEQCYRWQEVTEGDNENPTMIWQDYYSAIAEANHALAYIDKIGGATTDNLKAMRGEALLCRAYAHFILTNIFCQNYSKQYSSTDPGIPYTTTPETTLDPKYDRGTVADDYAKIEKDMLEGISLISDAIYKVPRYHFNTKAAYTFASRFYLFYQQPEKVIEYATKALGDNPKAVMRDYDIMQTMPTDNMQPRSIQYTSSSEKANFLLLPVYSTDQFYFSGYSTGARFNNNSYIGQAEEFFATPWAPSIDGATQSQQLFKFYWFYSQNYNKFMLPKQPIYFEEVNSSTHTGYQRTLVVALKSEEALLNRAEAYALTNQNAKALADINIWTGNFIADSVKYNTYKYDENWNYIYATAATNNVLTMQSINDWAKKYDYYRPERPMPRKHLHPEWINLTEGSDQENLIQCLLLIRRIEFLHEGMRWFDIKRYGMKIYRREINTSLNALTLTDSMSYRDPRQAIQIPFEVRGAGLQGNERPDNTSTTNYSSWSTNDNTTMFNK